MAVMWSSLEVQIAMITVCFPALRRLLAHFFPNLLGSTTASKGISSTSSKPISYPRTWQPPNDFITASTSTAIASGNHDREEVELSDNVVKVEGTFYVSTSLKSQKSIDSGEPLVIQGSRYNVTPQLPPETNEEYWGKDVRR
jgi:hypothetical protein